MTNTTAEILELPSRLERGEVRLSINLALIDNVPALYELVHSLGFTEPQLVLMHYVHVTEVHLLLYRNVFAVLTDSPDELYAEEQLALSNAIDSEAIRFSCGLTRSTEPIAA